MSIIFWAGDSTAARNYIDSYPQTGIGQVFDLYVKNGVEVRDYAVNGRSTKSFMDEGRLARIAREIRRGDYLFIQFGHNDEKDKDPTRYTEPFGAYTDNLRTFIDTARTRGAQPVLITPLERRHFGAAGRIEPTHGDYPAAVLQLAREEHVPCVDLNILSRELMDSVGDEASKEFFVHVPAGKYAAFPDGKEDNTHLRYHGAVTFAGLIAQALGSIPETAGLIRGAGDDIAEAADTVGEAADTDAACDAAFFAQSEKYSDIVTRFSSETEVRLPDRHIWSNKGTYGKLLVIAGNKGCAGAGYLCTHAAFMAGCGMVKVLTCADTVALLNNKQPEAMTGVLFKDDGGYDAGVLAAGLDWADCVLIGPGLGRSAAAKEVLARVLASGKKIVADADALNLIAETVGDCPAKSRPAAIASLFTAPAVLTPHIGEMARLSGKKADEIKARIFDTAYEYTYNNILTYVCKDARTLTAAAGRMHINTNGNSGMATAGSGDVLAGLIAGLMTAGLTPYEAARSGVYIHAAAGDAAADRACEDCITAGDIAECLPAVIARIRSLTRAD
ncbi:MAG: NAD(P)H-hydrate dehydratase [Lachnospiraceae bacterium]|nr:NAD(P)H-hydrate dehydratase [Lachnospiraceae bacterium]